MRSLRVQIRQHSYTSQVCSPGDCIQGISSRGVMMVLVLVEGVEGDAEGALG